jgi:hypothetical protein
MTENRYVCDADENGAPTCQDNGETCGPGGECVCLIHPNMVNVYRAFRRLERNAVALVEIVNKGSDMTMDERLQARVLLRGYGVEPDEMKPKNQETTS